MKNSLWVIALFLGVLSVSCETDPIVDENSTQYPDTPLNITTRFSSENQPIVPYFTLENKSTRKKVTYTFQNGVWKADTEPFLLKDLTINDKLLAEYEPLYEDPISHVKDILQVESTYNGKSEIEINFTHVNASFVLRVVNNTNETYTKVSVNLWNSLKIENFKDEQAIVIIPQTIPKGLVIQITVDGEVFSHVMERDLVLGKNKEVVYELNLTNRLLFDIQQKEWEVTNVNSDIIVPSIDKIRFAENGEFSFYIVNNQTNAIKKFTFDYIHEENKLVEIVSSVDKPFSWDMFPQTDTYTISGRFVPTNQGNPERDILEGTIRIGWGETIYFNNFIHINSKIEIQFKDMDVQFFNNPNSYIVFKGLNFGNSSNEYKIPLQKVIDVTVFPQTISDEATLKLIVDGKEYNSNINLIKLSGMNLTQFETGKKYVLTYTIYSYDGTDKNFTISYTMTDWNIVNGTGEFYKI